MVSACGDHMTFLTAYLQEDKQTLLSTCPVYEAKYLALFQPVFPLQSRMTSSAFMADTEHDTMCTCMAVLLSLQGMVHVQMQLAPTFSCIMDLHQGEVGLLGRQSTYQACS